MKQNKQTQRRKRPIDAEAYADRQIEAMLLGGGPLGPTSFRGIGQSIRRGKTVEETLKLDIRELTKAGLFKHWALLIESDADNNRELAVIDRAEVFDPDPEESADGCVSIRYGYQDEIVWEEIPLTVTLPPLGGRRVSFLCPECYERRDILYRLPFERDYACRTCHKLTYRSCQDSHKEPGAWSIQARELLDPPVYTAWSELHSETKAELKAMADDWQGPRMVAGD